MTRRRWLARKAPKPGAVAAVLLPLAGLALLSACASLLAPRPDFTRFFVLVPTLPSGAASSSSLEDVSIGLGPIRVPDHLRRPEIVTRHGDTEVRFSTARWAEPLDAALPRILTLNLSAALGPKRIVAYPWYRDDPPDFQVDVVFVRFERAGSDRVSLQARWEIRETATGTRLLARETTLERPTADDTGAAVTALNDALGELSREIAAAFRDTAGRRHQ